jgi:hypothetical protein
VPRRRLHGSVEHQGTDPLAEEAGVGRADRRAVREAQVRQPRVPDGGAQQVEVACDVGRADVRQHAGVALQAAVAVVPRARPQATHAYARAQERLPAEELVLGVAEAVDRRPAGGHAARVEADEVEARVQGGERRGLIADELDP